MLAKMVYKNMDKKNMLLYSFSIILSASFCQLHWRWLWGLLLW